MQSQDTGADLVKTQQFKNHISCGKVQMEFRQVGIKPWQVCVYAELVVPCNIKQKIVLVCFYVHILIPVSTFKHGIIGHLKAVL